MKTQRLLSAGSANTKLAKNQNPTWSLSLAQGNLSGFEVCPFRTEGCTSACVGSAGRAGTFPAIMQARIKKTRRFFEDRQGFLAQLRRELANADRWCSRKGVVGRVRLNTFSDIAWEHMLDLTEYKNLRFYDYTKNHVRAMRVAQTWGSVYRLCYSVNESTTDAMISDLLNAGGTVAVVFGDIKYVNFANKGRLPQTWRGYTVVDGDEHDDRYGDSYGVVVGLRLKGTRLMRQAAMDTGFARSAMTTLTLSAKPKPAYTVGV